MRTSAAVLEEIKELNRRLKSIDEELHIVREAELGLTRDKTVVIVTGTRYLFHRFYKFLENDRPWIEVFKFKNDGKPYSTSKTLYSNWEVEK